MSEIKLLALDLDGTLFTKDKQVTVENREALKAAEAKGGFTWSLRLVALLLQSTIF